MKAKYKIGKKNISPDIDLIFVETQPQGEFSSNVILDTIENKLISPNVTDYVDVQPEWLKHDFARLYVTNISKWATDECEIEI